MWWGACLCGHSDSGVSMTPGQEQGRGDRGEGREPGSAAGEETELTCTPRSRQEPHRLGKQRESVLNKSETG